MGKQVTSLILLIRALLKLNPRTPECRNVIAFVHSCYGGRVCSYDLDAAASSLSGLTPDEQHALIVWCLQQQEAASGQTKPGWNPCG
jgi:hypothetical protein